MIGGRSRKRTRQRQRNSRWRSAFSLLLVIGLIVALEGPGIVGAGLTTGAVSRPMTSDVVNDIDGAHNLNVTTELQEGQTTCLVEVTNYLGDSVTATISLNDNSTGSGTLQVSTFNTTKSGNSIDFSLSQGETQRVEMDVDDNTSGNTVYFDVNATGASMDVVATNRRAPIKNSAGTSCA